MSINMKSVAYISPYVYLIQMLLRSDALHPRHSLKDTFAFVNHTGVPVGCVTGVCIPRHDFVTAFWLSNGVDLKQESSKWAWYYSNEDRWVVEHDSLELREVRYVELAIHAMQGGKHATT